MRFNVYRWRASDAAHRSYAELVATVEAPDAIRACEAAGGTAFPHGDQEHLFARPTHADEYAATHTRAAPAPRLFNVYTWRLESGAFERVAQITATGATYAIREAKRRPELARLRLTAYRADRDPYASASEAP